VKTMEKRCPQCGRIYTGQFTFCPKDGSDLIVAETPQRATPDTPEPVTVTPPDGPSSIMPAATVPAGNTSYRKAESSGPSPVITILAAGVLCLGAGMHVVGSRNRQGYENRQINAAPQTMRPANQKGASGASAALPTTSPVVTPTGSTISNTLHQTKATEKRLSETDIHQLVDEWTEAQNHLNYPRYAALYAKDFTGVKRTRDGRKRNLNRTGWLRDRRHMMQTARGLEVSLSSRLVRLHGTWGEVSFEQYFRTQKYGDRGQKVLKVRATANGPRIFYEELLSSQPL
jgi:rRNA maturation protein Nop10